MKLSFTLDELAMRRGASMHFDHRSPVMRWIRPLLGVLLVLVGVSIVTKPGLPNALLGGFMILWGLFMVVRKIIWVQRCAKRALAGQQTENGKIRCTIMADQEGIEVDAAKSKSSAPWDAFGDFHVSPAGVLLYPRQSLFVWIPSDAQIEGGTWEDFCALLSEKVKKQI